MTTTNCVDAIKAKCTEFITEVKRYDRSDMTDC
jgi:hypothetical protein